MAFSSLSIEKSDESGFKQYFNPTYLVIGAVIAVLGGVAVKIVAGIFSPKAK